VRHDDGGVLGDVTNLVDLMVAVVMRMGMAAAGVTGCGGDSSSGGSSSSSKSVGGC
jgi:hypothetical protein